jgi:hypothetical protein
MRSEPSKFAKGSCPTFATNALAAFDSRFSFMRPGGNSLPVRSTQEFAVGKPEPVLMRLGVPEPVAAGKK